MSTLNKLVAWLIVIMIVSFTLSGYFFNRYGLNLNGNDLALWFTDSSLKDWNTIDQEEVDFSEINNLKIQTESADVILKNNPENEASTIQLTGSAPENAVSIKSSVSNKTLTVEVKKANGILSIQNLQVIVTLPSKKLDGIIIETTSGDTNLEIVSATSLTVQTTSGDLNATSLLVDMVDVNTGSGDIHLSSLAGDLHLKTTSGDIYSYYETFDDNVDIQTVSGDIRLAFEEPVDFELSFKTTSGDSNISIPVQIQKKSNAHNLHALSGEGTYPIKIKTVSGDLRID